MSAVSILAMMGVFVVQEVKLTGDPPINEQRFGRDVALWGNVALVGGPGYNNGSFGEATIFTAPGGDWTKATRTSLQQPMPFNHAFGSAVVLGDGCALVSAPPDNKNENETGAVYVYTLLKNVWSHTSTIKSNGPGDGFGYSLAASSNCKRAIVGVITRPINGVMEAGAAEIWEWGVVEWNVVASLAQPSQVKGNKFGYSVAMTPKGEAVVVGTLYEQDAPGRAYVYSEDDNWSDPVSIKGQSETQDGFGCSVAIAADGTMVVGAYREDNPENPDLGEAAGAAYVCPSVLQGDPQCIRFAINAGLGVGDGLGIDVAIEGDLIAIGSDKDDSENTGGVWLSFRNMNEWTVGGLRLKASDGKKEDLLGQAVAVSGLTVIAGAEGFDPLPPPPDLSNAGAAYVFTFDKKKGDECVTPESCVTGFCVDGFCCDAACGDSDPGDCLACDVMPGICMPPETEMCDNSSTGNWTDSATDSSAGSTASDSTNGATDGSTGIATSSDSTDGSMTAVTLPTTTENTTSGSGPTTSLGETTDSTTTPEGHGFDDPCECSASGGSAGNGLWLAFLLFFRRRRGDLARPSCGD